MTSLWLPVVTTLVCVDAVWIAATLLAPIVGRWRLRRWRRRNRGRAQVTVAAPSVPDTDTVPVLLRRLADPDAATRLAAARQVGRRCTVGDGPRICEALTAADRATRRVLLASLSRRNLPVATEVRLWAVGSKEPQRLSAIRMLGTTADLRARQTLEGLLADADPMIQRHAAAAVAASARVGFPQPLEPGIVDSLLSTVEGDRVRAVSPEVLDALVYSLDERVPALLLRCIPSSSDLTRDHLVEAAALVARLTRAANRTRLEARR